MSAPEVDAVVLGAGGSARMAGLDKMLAPLGDREVIVWSLRAFEAAPSIRRVVVTSSAENRSGIERAIDAAGLAKVVGVINGGPSRAHSVLNALDVLEDDGARFAAIHDGARPFVTDELIERGVAAVRRHGAVVAAVPSSDTVKLVGSEGVVIETPPRAQVWLAQTPQLGRLHELLAAHRRRRERLAGFTDDVSVLEADGITVYVFEADAGNFKISAPADLERARRIVAAERSAR